jgi:hypothetical protein
LVPVSFKPSRTTQSSGVSGGASTDTGLPLIVKFVAIAFPPAVRAERIRSGSSGVSNIRAAVAAG